MTTTTPVPDAATYVGFWARVLAAIIDTLLWCVIAVPLTLLIYGTEYYTEDPPSFQAALARGPADVLISWILPTIAVLAFWHFRQATPGKMAVSARIVDARTGTPPSFGQYVVRYLGYFVSLLPCCLGYLWVAFDPRKQGWHDKFARTLVVRTRAAG